MGNFCCFPIHKQQQPHQQPHQQLVPLNLAPPMSPPFFGDRMPNFALLRTRPPDGVDVDIFDYHEMADATSRWDNGKIIGQGGFGHVYKGVLRANLRPKYVNDIQVAIKDHNFHKHQGDIEWLSEIKTLGKFRNPNLVKLIGYCCEYHNTRILVYEYMENGSLDKHLFSDEAEVLSWPNRMKIALHAARGLAFLHHQERPIICRDIKTANILLDKDFNAKLSDLGFAREGHIGDQVHVSTRLIGTPGYTAPEYFQNGQLTKYCDVYSFGVVLLELLFGCKVIGSGRDPNMRNLVEVAHQSFYEDDNILSMMDTRLKESYPEQTALKVATLACECTNRKSMERPEMSKVIEILESIQENAGVKDQNASSSSTASDKSNPIAIKGEGSSSSTQHQVPISGSGTPGQTSHQSSGSNVTDTRAKGKGKAVVSF